MKRVVRQLPLGLVAEIRVAVRRAALAGVTTLDDHLPRLDAAVARLYLLPRTPAQRAWAATAVEQIAGPLHLIRQLLVSLGDCPAFQVEPLRQSIADILNASAIQEIKGAALKPGWTTEFRTALQDVRWAMQPAHSAVLAVLEADKAVVLGHLTRPPDPPQDE